MEIRIDDPHSGQVKIIKERSRFNVVATGRRFGKTTLLMILLAMMATYNLNKRRPANIAVVCPTLLNLMPIWKLFLNKFESYITFKSEQYHYVTIQDLFNIEFWSIEQIENMRGRAYCMVLLDEAALIKGLKEIWSAIMFPTLSDWQGSAWFFSTPKGFNDFHTFFNYGNLIDFEDTWSNFHATFLDNPFNKLSEYQLAQKQLSADYFAQEYNAEFVSLGNNLFNREYLPVVKPGDYKGKVVLRCRYHDIANSHKGDFTASLRLTVTDEPAYYFGYPFHMQGKWSQVFPFMKKLMLAEMQDNVKQVIETDGIGGIAFQVIMGDSELVGVPRFPADRRFTAQGKYEKAQLVALEAQMGRVFFEDNPLINEVLDEFEKFPYGRNNDYIDTASGGLLSINLLFGNLLNLTDVSDRTERQNKLIVDKYQKRMRLLLAEFGDTF